jgi:hypothetical protein
MKPSAKQSVVDFSLSLRKAQQPDVDQPCGSAAGDHGNDVPKLIKPSPSEYQHAVRNVMGGGGMLVSVFILRDPLHSIMALSRGILRFERRTPGTSNAV